MKRRISYFQKVEILHFVQDARKTLCKRLRSFFRYGTCSKNQIPPNPPLSKGENYKELLLKSPFEKGGLRQQCPVRKLHAAVLPPSPQPSPPEAGGEGEGGRRV